MTKLHLFLQSENCQCSYLNPQCDNMLWEGILDRSESILIKQSSAQLYMSYVMENQQKKNQDVQEKLKGYPQIYANKFFLDSQAVIYYFVPEMEFPQ